MVVPNGIAVPANAPALVLELSAPFGLDVSLRSSMLTGPGDIGLTAVADSHRPATTLLRLGSEMTARFDYRLDFEIGCTQSGEDVPEFPVVWQTRFATVAPVALPVTIGRIILVPPPAGDPFTYLAFDPSPELAAFLPLTSLSVHARGAVWAQLHYGQARTATDSSYAKSTCGQLGLASCVPMILSRLQLMSEWATTARGTSPLCGPTDGASATIDFALAAHVAGAESDPTPLTFSAPISCSDGASPRTDKAPSTPNLPSVSASGCGAAASQTSVDLTLLTIATLALFAVSRWRARRN
jgi:hypothetical protein